MADNNDESKKIIISVGADATQFKSEIDDAAKELDKLSDTNVEIKSDSIKNLKQQLKEANNEAQRIGQTFGQNSVEFANAVSRVAELRDEVDVYNRTVEAFDPGNKFNAFIGIAKGAATAVQGIAGALTVVGVDAETANEAIAKLQGIMAFTDSINAIGDLQDYWKGYILTLRTASTAQTAVAETTEVTTVATKGFGTAFKAIGIGALVALLAYVVTNFDSIKASVQKVIPAVGDLGKTFDTIKSVLFGVGNAILTYIATPIRVIVDLINGEFKQAMGEFKKGLDVAGNYKAGKDAQDKRNAESNAKDALETTIKSQEDQLAVLKAGGKDTDKLQRTINQNKLNLYKDDAKKLKETQQDIKVYEAGQQKEAADKAKQAADKQEQLNKAAAAKAKAAADKAAQEKKDNLKEVADNNAEANKLISDYNKTAREKELNDVNIDYQKKIKVYAKYNQDTSKLTEAYNLQRSDINKKYDDEINNFLKTSGDERLSEYDKLRADVNKKYNDISKNAVGEQKDTLEQLRKNALAEIQTIQDADNNLKDKKKVTDTVSNEDTTGDEIDELLKHNEDLHKAKVEQEQAQYDDDLARAKGQQNLLEQAEKDHKDRMTTINKDFADANLKVTQAKADAEKIITEKGNEIASAAIELVGQNTIAAKAIGVAQAGINTYIGASEVLKSPSILPEPYGSIAKIASMAAIIGVGIANVKKIVSIKIPSVKSSGASSSISAPSIAGATAPTVSAAPQNLLPQDVRVVNSKDTVVKAYITDKDLKNNDDRNDFVNKLSTF